MSQEHNDDISPSDDLSFFSISEPENALPRVGLDDVPELLRTACAQAGWTQLMPVQSLALPYLLAGRDIMVQSRTGSGKTGCYLLPLLPRLDPELHAPQALVLVPTRELAVQVEHEAATLFAGTGLRTVAVYGGVGYKKQMEALREGAQVLVGTPGRVLDHLLRHTLDLEALRVLVFDEADRMLSIGFYPDMKEVQRYLPRRRIHTCLFSATYPPHVLKLAGEFMTSPDLLSLSRKEVHVAEVQHLFCRARPMEKDRVLVRLLETENPASAIIFCNTKANVHYVADVLKGFGYNADELSADLSQNRREAVLNKIRQGKLQYLVATDVAARGIDIPQLSHVFLYEPPEDHESYIHRAGRTGRAGAAGTVISLVDVMQLMELERIAAHFRIALSELPAPSDADVAAAVGQRLVTILEARYRGMTGLEKVRIARYVPLARTLAGLPPGEDGAAVADEDDTRLLAMLLDACHQQSLHETRFPDGGDDERGQTRKERSRGGRSRRRRDGARREGAAEPEADGGANAADRNAPAESGERREGRRRRRRSRRSSGGSGSAAQEPAAADRQEQDA